VAGNLCPVILFLFHTAALSFLRPGREELGGSGGSVKHIPYHYVPDICRSIIVTNSNPTDFLSDKMTEFEYLNKWFKANSLSFNFEKAHLI
jgi:hypothetical protein